MMNIVENIHINHKYQVRNTLAKVMTIPWYHGHNEKQVVGLQLAYKEWNKNKDYDIKTR
jgi:hypothetical protein